ncbi:MAG: hypothetical protein LBG96_13595 [Tannerella sp.]|jgi:hypothetical protein|nr:hypothetical protein [Tannerella sp.]
MENQNPIQNQNYTANYVVPKNQSVVTIGDWIITYILMVIPLVNMIMLFVWAFGANTPESKANWAKATLIIYLISIMLVICFWGAMIVGAAVFGITH